MVDHDALTTAFIDACQLDPLYSGPIHPRATGTGLSHPGGAATARRAGACADPGAASGRDHNRQYSDQPLRQATSDRNTGHRTTPAAMISHCAQVETLPIA